MYSAYFVNTKTGELYLSFDPKNNKYGDGWEQIDYEKFILLEKVAFYYHNQD